MKGPPGLSNSPRPTCAVGWRPASQHPDGILCPVAGAGSPGVSRLRAARIVGPVGANSCRVCRWQTAIDLVSHPAPHESGGGMPDQWQARASGSQRLASGGLSFPLRPQPYGGRSSGEKTVARFAEGSGTSCSEAPGFRPTGRKKPAPLRKIRGQASPSVCAIAPALVTGQEPVGTDVPGVAQRRCERALRQHLHHGRG